jgi:hypothetical protein
MEKIEFKVALSSCSQFKQDDIVRVDQNEKYVLVEKSNTVVCEEKVFKIIHKDDVISTYEKDSQSTSIKKYKISEVDGADDEIGYIVFWARFKPVGRVRRIKTRTR